MGSSSDLSTISWTFCLTSSDSFLLSSINFFSTQVYKLVLYNNGSIYLKGFDGQGIVEIYSIIGNKIYAFELQNLNDIALSYPLKSGNMYIIRVITTKKAETFKIVA